MLREIFFKFLKDLDAELKVINYWPQHKSTIIKTLIK